MKMIRNNYSLTVNDKKCYKQIMNLKKKQIEKLNV